MIRYSLRCADGHGFESWFSDAAGFDALRGRGMVECPDCGSTEVDRALMAPRVRPARSQAEAPKPAALPAPAKPDAPKGPPDPDTIAKVMAHMRAEVEKRSTYVGKSFAAEARAIHEGTSDKGSIWGEATPKEARALAEDGIEIMPLPFGPREKQN